MANITLVSTGIPDLLPMKRSGDPSRHISAIVRYLCLKLGHFKETEGGPEQTRMELGSAFEEAVIYGLAERHAIAHPGRYARTGELELDGLIGTPDLADFVDNAVLEMKLTWMSARHAEDPECENFWKYWTQLKAYVHMMGWRVGYLHVGFINGDYRERVPRYHVYRAEFSERELMDNWRMLVSNGERMRATQR